MYLGRWNVSNFPVRFYAVRGQGNRGYGRTARWAHIDSEEPRLEDAMFEIGVDCDWEDCFTTLCHEVFELVVTGMGCSYETVSSLDKNTQGRVFMFTHKDYGDAMARSASVVGGVTHSLQEAHEEAQEL